jgi:hypothetical protein
MLFDLISTVEITVGAAIVAAVLSFTLSENTGGRLRAAWIVATWFVIVVAFGATGALDAQSGAGVVGLGVAVMLPIAALCLAFFASRTVHSAMLAIPLPVLIAVHSVRIAGISFVLLYAAQRLPAPFAPVAGWGDVFIGLTAAPLAWLVARRAAQARPLALVWNAIGFLDLAMAIALGATSSPGPFRLFMDAPGTPIMTTLPWILIPCFLVPCLWALHIAIFYRLNRNAHAIPSRLASA